MCSLPGPCVACVVRAAVEIIPFAIARFRVFCGLIVPRFAVAATLRVFARAIIRRVFLGFHQSPRFFKSVHF